MTERKSDREKEFTRENVTVKKEWYRKRMIRERVIKKRVTEIEKKWQRARVIREYFREKERQLKKSDRGKALKKKEERERKTMYS